MRKIESNWGKLESGNSMQQIEEILQNGSISLPCAGQKRFPPRERDGIVVGNVFGRKDKVVELVKWNILSVCSFGNYQQLRRPKAERRCSVSKYLTYRLATKSCTKKRWIYIHSFFSKTVQEKVKKTSMITVFSWQDSFSYHYWRVSYHFTWQTRIRCYRVLCYVGCENNLNCFSFMNSKTHCFFHIEFHAKLSQHAIVLSHHNS